MLLNYEQRNSDFLRAVRRAARRNMEQGTTLNSRDLVREVLSSGAPAWYITTDYAWRRLKLLKAGKLHTLLDDILSGSAATPSRFFISEEYALRLFTGSARRAPAIPRPPAGRHRRLPASRPGHDKTTTTT